MSLKGEIFEGETRDAIVKWKDQYGWPPCTNFFSSADLYIDNITYLCDKTSYLHVEVNCTESFPSDSLPWWEHHGLVGFRVYANRAISIEI